MSAKSLDCGEWYRPYVGAGALMRCLHAILVTVVTLVPVPTTAEDGNAPTWKSGVSSEILPGFEPVAVSGTTVRLSVGRAYIWSSSYLPVRVDSRETQLAGPQVLKLGGETLIPSTVSISESASDHAVVKASGTAVGGALAISVETRVEYDGAAFVTLTLTPSGSVPIPSLLYRVDIQHPNDFLTMLRFDTIEKAPDQQTWIRIQGRARRVKPLTFDGVFQNAVQFQDGEKAFTWFADDAKGWIWNSGNVTQVIDNGIGSTVTLTQKIIGATYTLPKPVAINFQFMASPAKPLVNGWRTRLRPQSVFPTTEQAKNHGHVFLYWPPMLCQITLPYADCPPEVRALMPPADRNKWRGIDHANLGYSSPKTYLAQSRLFGTDVLLYFSSLLTSLYDPVIRANQALWEVGPTARVIHETFPPYPKQDRAVFSLRRDDWLDYRLGLLDRVITAYGRPGLEGIYLDQTQLWDSEADNGDGWADSNGVMRRSTNIVGLRNWLKRLRTVFVNRNTDALIYAHDSASELAPILSFMTVSVDGEQFTSPARNPNNDYAVDVSTDLWRTEFAANQFGVPVAVISEKQGGGVLSSTQARGFFAQLLLHDCLHSTNAIKHTDIWPVEDVLDGFGYDAADSVFSGYWSSPSGASCTVPCYVSYYKRTTENTALLIVSNLSATPGPVSVKVNDEALVGGSATFTPRYPAAAAIKETNGAISVPVGARDYQMIEVRRSGSS